MLIQEYSVNYVKKLCSFVLLPFLKFNYENESLTVVFFVIFNEFLTLVSPNVVCSSTVNSDYDNLHNRSQSQFRFGYHVLMHVTQP